MCGLQGLENMKKADLLELISNGENSGVEFKRDDIRPEQLAKEVVALANLAGGRILLGVDDDGSIFGITRKNLCEWVFDTVVSRYIHPALLPYYEEILLDSGKRIAVITVGQECSKPYVVRLKDREDVYIRVGNVSRLATREQQARLYAFGGLIHAELMPVSGTSFDSLDLSRLENYIRDILNDIELPQKREDWIQRLLGLGFMVENANRDPVSTIAGLVLFGIKPRQFLKQAGVRLMFFQGLDKEYQADLDRVLDLPMVGRLRVTPSGKSLVEEGLIEKSVELMGPYVSREANGIDENFRREREWFYPQEAIRELLMNALVHRDWTRFTEIEVCGYADRLEILSPGSLPNSMTIEKMKAGQRSARNSLIVEVLRDYGYVDARGMGIRTKVLPLMKAAGKEPIFEETEDYMRTVLGRLKGQDQPQHDPINDLLNAIRSDPRADYETLAQVVGVSQATIKRYIQKLKQDNRLERVGSKKTGHWKIF